MGVTVSQVELFKLQVHYTGSDKLQEGYSLCYDQDATYDLTTTPPTTDLGYHVEKPATANLLFFAGFVAPESAGRTGPLDVWVIRPFHSVFANVYVDNATNFAVGSLLILQDGSYGLTHDAAAVGDEGLAVARSLEVLTPTTGTIRCLIGMLDTNSET